MLAIELVVKEQVVILHLPACHDEGLDDGKHQVAEILLVVQQHKEAETEGENEKQNRNRKRRCINIVPIIIQIG